jgi:hypothetical protein
VHGTTFPKIEKFHRTVFELFCIKDVNSGQFFSSFVDIFVIIDNARALKKTISSHLNYFILLSFSPILLLFLFFSPFSVNYFFFFPFSVNYYYFFFFLLFSVNSFFLLSLKRRKREKKK